MKIRIVSSIVCAVALLASAGGAQEVNWAKDPVDSIKAQLHASAPDFIEAQALDSALLQMPNADDNSVDMVINEGGNRVGAVFNNCYYNGGGGDGPTICGMQIRFIFRELSVVGNEIRMGDSTVGVIAKWHVDVRNRDLRGVKLADGYALNYHLIPISGDNGFDRTKTSRVEVYLEKTAAH